MPAIPKSIVPGIDWPAVSDDTASRLLALLRQLEETQWWPVETLAARQYRQLGHLLAHAFETVPYYRAPLAAAGYRPGTAITPEFWRTLPILGRREIRQSFDALSSRRIPGEHGASSEAVSSGSTGTPITVLKTALENLLWNAVTLRDEVWHRRDGSSKLAVIRAGGKFLKSAAYPAGLHLDDWGPPLAVIYRTGPGAILSIVSGIGDQAEWLNRENPAYLLTMPSNLAELAKHFRDTRQPVPALRGIRTVGEVVDSVLRDLCRQTFGVGITDMYTATEVGYIALQCPEHDHYHVQSESILVEVLDPEGRPCKPGEVGMVVVTPLHNFAMPLIRYAIGDMAEVGAPCPCGRGLPVLNRILGRVREMVVMPSGARRFPTGWFRDFSKIDGLVQFQIVQKGLTALEVRLITRPPFAPADEDKIRKILQHHLGQEFAVAVSYHDEIPRAASGKYFEFVSEIAD